MGSHRNFEKGIELQKISKKLNTKTKFQKIYNLRYQWGYTEIIQKMNKMKNNKVKKKKELKSLKSKQLFCTTSKGVHRTYR